MNPLYFDNAATTPMDPRVIQHITQLMSEVYGNPSSTHGIGRKAKSIVEQARKDIASCVGAASKEIIFTGSGSEADNLILRNAVENLGVKRIISSRIEHAAVLETIEDLKRTHSIEVDWVKLNPDASIDIKNLELLLESKTEPKTLVSLMYTNNEIGVVLDIEEVGTLCHAKGAYFHTDAVQAVGHIPIDLKQGYIDFLAASAHKFHGPKGVGFAYFQEGLGIKPMVTGGGQEKGARSGTENVYQISGMALALKLARDEFQEDHKHLLELKEAFVKGIKRDISGVEFNAFSDHLDKEHAAHILSVRFPGSNPMFLFNLDLKHVSVSGGSACQSGSQKGSHVLQEILDPQEQLKDSVRVSFSKFNTLEEVDLLLKALS